MLPKVLGLVKSGHFHGSHLEVIHKMGVVCLLLLFVFILKVPTVENSAHGGSFFYWGF